MSECAICGGVGLVRVMSPTGLWVSRACECQEMQREERRLAAARIPAGYWECTLDTYETAFSGADQSQARALLTARKFVEAYPVDTAGKGLLFIGSLGVGKTHLAVGVLRRLLKERGARGIFCDYGALVKEIQMSFNPRSSATEYDLLDPILTTEVLVVDDLGAQKPTDWVWDNVALILNTRYNNKLTTIVTTNYPDLPPGGGGQTDAERAGRELTLGDRIGERMRSRLAEMCIRVDMTGRDFRQTVKRARFG
ncbi:MAG TPA: ATP-binding protein [Terracidiphilus sp.]|nr:ATP-binding protein [Terracidiphilus sp.]